MLAQVQTMLAGVKEECNAIKEEDDADEEDEEDEEDREEEEEEGQAEPETQQQVDNLSLTSRKRRRDSTFPGRFLGREPTRKRRPDPTTSRSLISRRLRRDGAD